MNLQIIFATLASVIGTLSFIPYIRDIFRLKTTPHTYSWLIWAILQATATSAMLSKGASFGVVTLAIGSLLCAFIFLLSLRYGTKNITTFDTICFIGALAGTGMWLFLHNALLSVCIVSVVDLIAFLPTFRKAYADPYSETPSTYLLSFIADGLALFALSAFSLTTSLYLFTLVATNLACVSVIFIRRKHPNSTVSK